MHDQAPLRTNTCNQVLTKHTFKKVLATNTPNWVRRTNTESALMSLCPARHYDPKNDGGNMVVSMILK
jgi:hypothetical protein